jgi:hypothetical protein
MVTRIGETADTSKESIVRELRLEEVSTLHEEELKDITEDVLRFDFPVEYSIRLGFQYDNNEIYLSKKGHTLFFSCHDMGHDPTESIILTSYLYKPKGFPKSKVLDMHDDSRFICIPKYFAENFKVGDNITYSLVKATEEVERHVVCNVS